MTICNCRTCDVRVCKRGLPDIAKFPNAQAFSLQLRFNAVNHASLLFSLVLLLLFTALLAAGFTLPNTISLWKGRKTATNIETHILDKQPYELTSAPLPRRNLTNWHHVVVHEGTAVHAEYRAVTARAEGHKQQRPREWLCVRNIRGNVRCARPPGLHSQGVWYLGRAAHVDYNRLRDVHVHPSVAASGDYSVRAHSHCIAGGDVWLVIRTHGEEGFISAEFTTTNGVYVLRISVGRLRLRGVCGVRAELPCAWGARHHDGYLWRHYGVCIHLQERFLIPWWCFVCWVACAYWV